MRQRDEIKQNNDFHANANAPIHDENNVISMKNIFESWSTPHPLNTIKAAERKRMMLSNCCLFIAASQTSKTLGSKSIWYLSDANVSDRCLADVFDTWACDAICSCWTF